MAENIDKRQTDTRERLFSIALDLFSKNGVDGTSIRDIAGEAGISAAAFYNHFSSKDALLQSIYAHYMAKQGEFEREGFTEVDGILAESGPSGLLESLTERFRASLANPELEKLARLILMEQYRNPVAAEIVHKDRGKLVSAMEELFPYMQAKGYLPGRDARLVGRMAAYLLLGLFGDNEYRQFIAGESVDAILADQRSTMREFLAELIGGR